MPADPHIVQKVDKAGQSV